MNETCNKLLHFIGCIVTSHSFSSKVLFFIFLNSALWRTDHAKRSIELGVRGVASVGQSVTFVQKHNFKIFRWRTAQLFYFAPLLGKCLQCCLNRGLLSKYLVKPFRTVPTILHCALFQRHPPDQQHYDEQKFNHDARNFHSYISTHKIEPKHSAQEQFIPIPSEWIEPL